MAVLRRKPKTSKAVMFRVTPEGTLAPNDDISRQTLRKRQFRVGDLVTADPKKPRNHRAWSRAHKLAQLLIENVEDFANMNPHPVLKRLMGGEYRLRRDGRESSWRWPGHDPHAVEPELCGYGRGRVPSDLWPVLPARY